VPFSARRDKTAFPRINPICAEIGLVRMVFAPQGLQDSARLFNAENTH
jgi:hypothetical protein